MILKRTLYLSLAIVGLAAAGCGGSGSSNNTALNPINTTKSTPSLGSTAPTTIPSSGSATTSNFPVTSNGTTTQTPAYIPAGTTITAGDPVALIPTTFPFVINGGTTGSIAHNSRASRAIIPGEIYYTGGSLTNQPTGLHLSAGTIVPDATTATANYVAVDLAGLKGSSLTLAVAGPITIGPAATPLNLAGSGDAVNSAFSVHFASFVAASDWPTTTKVTLPQDGGSIAQANIGLTFPGVSGTGQTWVYWPGVTKTYTATSDATNTLTFLDPGGSSTNDSIPGAGITNVNVNLSF